MSPIMLTCVILSIHFFLQAFKTQTLSPDGKVEWQFWTSSSDGKVEWQFRRDFDSTAIVINQAKDVVFTPHMYILNGSHWSCDTSGLPCNQQCSNSGRYCAVDPEYDLEIGLDGIDVVQEDLRSLCVWEFDKARFGTMDDGMWWNYGLLWDENCGILQNDTQNTFNEICSYAQMDKLDVSGQLKSYVQNCIIATGGYGFNDGVNKMLNREVRFKYNSSIHYTPTVVVNGFQIRYPNCQPPITKSSCEVLAAICNEFINGTQPYVCSNSTTDPTIAIKTTTSMPTVKTTTFYPTQQPTYKWRTTGTPTFQQLTRMPTPIFDSTYSYGNHIPTTISTPEPTYYYSAVTTTRVEDVDSLSMVMILLIVIGLLVLLLGSCGIYILYVKYRKKRNIHLDYIQNVISVEGEGDTNVGEQDYDEDTEGNIVIDESNPTTALAQTNKL